MSHKLFTIYDSKAEAHGLPFGQKTTGLAIRMFEQAVNDEQSSISRHPADYTLFEIAEYNECLGKIDVHKNHINVGNGLPYVKEKIVQPPVER